MILFTFIISIPAQSTFNFKSGHSFYNFSSNDFLRQAFFYDFFLEFSIARFHIIAGNYGMVGNSILEYNPLDTDFMTTFNMFARFQLARGLLECSDSFSAKIGYELYICFVHILKILSVLV